MDDKEEHKDSVSPNDKIEKSKVGLVAPSAENYKTAKEYIKTHKVTNTSTLISNYNHQYERKYFWNPKYQLMFLFCLEQELVLL